MWGNVRKAKAQIEMEIASVVKRKEKRLHQQEENELGSVGPDPGKEKGGSQRRMRIQGVHCLFFLCFFKPAFKNVNCKQTPSTIN